MNEFINFLKKEKIVQELINYYKIKNNFVINFKNFINNKSHLDSDFNNLGKIYEKSLDYNKRKKLGEFYTPNSIVNYILDAVGYDDCKDIQTKKLMDLSCGTGSFIVQTIKILIKSCLKSFKKDNFSKISSKEAIYIVSKVKENIIGIDINPIACILCQINIYFELFELIEVIKEQDKNYHPPRFNIINANALTVKDEFVYDFVVGNPPYLFIRDIEDDQKQLIEKGNFDTSIGQYDYYQIFIELGIRLLKNKGKLGYIVPDSLLVLSNRSILRKYVYNNTKIKEIYNIGPKFKDPIVSNIILVLAKEPNVLERERNSIKIKISNEIPKEIFQKTLEKWDYKFLIHLSNTDINIINYLTENFPKLKEFLTKPGFIILLSRGIELTKRGEIVYCNKCKKYFPIPKKELICPRCNVPLKKKHIEKIIFESVQNEDKDIYKLFINSINRYRVKDYNFIRINKKGINYKDFEIYRDRIIIRQLNQNNLICATYDSNLSLTSQSFYNLKVVQSPIREFNNTYLLGIINSKLLSYYFIKSFGSYKKLFPRILIEKIKDFPIKIPENNKELEIASKIINKVEILLELNGSEIYKSAIIQNDIDKLVFELYEIPYSHQIYILEFINNL